MTEPLLVRPPRLGFLSLVFDAVFMWQHYVLYAPAARGTARAAPAKPHEEEHLIDRIQ